MGPILTKVVRALHEGLDLDDIYTLVKDQLLQVIRAQRILVSFLDRDRTKLMAFVLHDELPGEITTGFSIPKHYAGPWKAVLTAEPVLGRPIKGGVAEDPLAAQKLLSYVCLPIMVRGKCVGVLELASDGKTPHEVFGREHLAVLRPLADLLGLALDRQRNLDEVKDLVRKSEMVRALGQLALRRGSFDAFVREALNQVQSSFGYCNASYFQVDKKTQEFELVALAGMFKRTVMPGARQSVEEGLLGRAYRMSTVIMANDVSADPDFEAVAGVEINSELVVPVVLGIDVQGVLLLSSPSLNHFSEHDQVVGEMLALIFAMKISQERDAAVRE